LHLDLSAFNFTFNLDNDLGEVSSTLDIPFFGYGVDIEGSPVSGNLTVPETVQISQGFSFPLVEFSSIINPLQIGQGFDLGGVDLSSIVEALKFDFGMTGNINLLIDDLILQTDQTQSVIGGDPGDDFLPPGAYLGPKIQLYPFSRSVDQGFNFSLPDEMSTSNDFDVDSIGLLDFFPGAVAAYSLRSLDLNYSGDAVRVRRDSDDAEQDFGFDASGNLDVAGVTSFCGAANGYAVTWYDQSGNGNDASQNVFLGSQPQIYDGSQVLTENGKPVLYCFGNSLESSAALSSGTGARAMFAVAYCGVTPSDSNTIFRNSTSFQGSGADWNWTAETAVRVDGSVTWTTNPMDQQMIGTLLFPGSGTTSDVDFYENGSVITQTSTTNTTINTGSSSVSKIGSANIRMQEFILYNSDQSSKRSGIESNISTHYFGPDKLLNTYGGAEAAYSVRNLNKYATLSMRVRRDSDDAEQDFGFDSAGDLDVAGITSFCGNSNGYAVTWYDQSGSGNDVTQATTSNQPKIYDGSVVLTKNGKPALDLDQASSGDYFEFSTADFAGQFTDVFVVGAIDNYSYNGCIILGSQTTSNTYWQFGNTNKAYYQGAAANITAIAVDDSQQRLMELYGDATTQNVVYDSVEYTDAQAISAVPSGTRSYQLGRYQASNQWNWDGQLQEVIVWGSDQSTNRTGIESDINNYFNIYDA